MSNRRKPWDRREKKHWRRVEKRRKQSKVVRAPIPTLNDAVEELNQPTTTG